MKLSENFTLDELTNSEIALRRDIDNTPTADVLQNLRMLADGLERVRSVLGHPMRISSGYRSPLLNAIVGGSRNSYHIRGLAADFTCTAFGTPRDVAMAIVTAADSIDYDSIIHEGRWVHIQFSDNPRRQVMTARFANGGVSYTKGLV